MPSFHLNDTVIAKTVNDTTRMDKIGKYQFLAEPFHCDFSHRIFMSHMGNHMLNAADFHSHERGFGMAYLNTLHKTWVLSRFAVEMEEMPLQYTKFFVETWVESAMKYFTDRNFRIADQTGRTLGYGRSVWAMIDTDTRQPQDLTAIRDGEITEWVEIGKECPIERPSRVKIPMNAECVRTIDTYYSDMDINGHVNSVKYLEHVLDLFDVNWHKTHRIKRFDMAYVAESHSGDRLSFRMAQIDGNEYCVCISKCADMATDEPEVCRCKVKFINI